jgi:hypothetical protein
MAIFVFNCPNANQHIEGRWSADHIAEHGDTCIPVKCRACGRLHYINPLTSRVLGSDDGAVRDK